MPSVRPICNQINCFANKCGRYCDILTDNPSNPCPFYKTDEQVEEGRVQAHRKLVDDGAFDLIEKYEYNPYRRGQW